MEASDTPQPQVAMSLPEGNADAPGADPPTKRPEPAPVSEPDTPRDAVFLTEAQDIRKRIDAIGAGVMLTNVLLGALVALVAAYVLKARGGAVTPT